jgi:hypothetical protein
VTTGAKRRTTRHNAVPAKLSRQMRAILEWIYDRTRDKGGEWLDFTATEFLGIEPSSLTRSQQNSVLRSVERLESKASGLLRRRKTSGAGYDGKPIRLRLTDAGARTVEALRAPVTARDKSVAPVYYLAQEADMALLEYFRYATLIARGRRPDETQEEWEARWEWLEEQSHRRLDRILELRNRCPEVIASAQANFLSAMTRVYPKMFEESLYLDDEIELSRGYETRLWSELVAAGLDPAGFTVHYSSQRQAELQSLRPNEKRMTDFPEVPF